MSTVADSGPGEPVAAAEQSSVEKSAGTDSGPETAEVATEAQPSQNEASGDVVGNSASAQPVENSATVAEAQPVQSEASSDVAGASASAQSGTNNATTTGSTATAAEASTGNSQSSAVDASVSSTPSSQTSGPQNNPGLPAESNATGTGDAPVIAPVAQPIVATVTQPVVPVPTQVTEMILPDNPPEALPDELVVVSTDQINITELLLSNDFDPDGGQPTIVSV